MDDEVIRGGGEILEFPIIDEFEMPGQAQRMDYNPAEGATDWEMSFSLEVPADLPSGIYAAKCMDDDETIYIPFIINPTPHCRNRFLVLANTNTWNAYNDWGGYSRYYEVRDFANFPDIRTSRDLSFLRPNLKLFNLSLEDGNNNGGGGDGPYGFTSKHRLRGELWVLNWLKQSPYAFDVYTDLDFHIGIEGIDDYDAIILTTHPEYWSIEMAANLKDYLNQGGNLLYLGGNGIFDTVTISDETFVMRVYGTLNERTKLLSQVGLPESAILGVATPRQVVGPGIMAAVGNNWIERVAYKVSDPGAGAELHRFFCGTGLQPGDEFGGCGWFLATSADEASYVEPRINNSGASGGECDQADGDSPHNLQVLARGINSEVPADMTYYDHEGGGFVFSVGSISFGGSLVVDKVIQQIICNALGSCR